MQRSLVCRVRLRGSARAGLVTALVLTAGSALACSSGEGVTPRPAESSPPAGRPGLSLQVEWSPERIRQGQEMVWRLVVTNGGTEGRDLEFGSGQSGDVVLIRQGREVQRWSRDRVFTQEVRNEPLGAGESRTYELNDRIAVGPGDYEVEATLTSSPAPPPAIVRLEVDA